MSKINHNKSFQNMNETLKIVNPGMFLNMSKNKNEFMTTYCTSIAVFIGNNTMWAFAIVLELS